MHSYAVTGPSSLPNIGRWRTGSGSQVLALNYGLPDPHQLDGPITTKALLNGVNHGFQCNAPAVIKKPLAQNKQSLHIDAGTYQGMQNFACLMVNGDLLSTRQDNVIDEHNYLMSIKRAYPMRFPNEQFT
jgi:hypothetical protein